MYPSLSSLFLVHNALKQAVLTIVLWVSECLLELTKDLTMSMQALLSTRASAPLDSATLRSSALAVDSFVAMLNILGDTSVRSLEIPTIAYPFRWAD